MASELGSGSDGCSQNLFTAQGVQPRREAELDTNERNCSESAADRRRRGAHALPVCGCHHVCHVQRHQTVRRSQVPKGAQRTEASSPALRVGQSRQWDSARIADSGPLREPQFFHQFLRERARGRLCRYARAQCTARERLLLELCCVTEISHNLCLQARSS